MGWLRHVVVRFSASPRSCGRSLFRDRETKSRFRIRRALDDAFAATASRHSEMLLGNGNKRSQIVKTDAVASHHQVNDRIGKHVFERRFDIQARPP